MAGFTYKSYSFIDKDPICDYVRTAVQESHMTYKALSEQSGVNRTTIRNMLDGETRRPQAATINAILRTCGYKLTVRPINDMDVISPTIVSVRHVVQMAKYKTKKAKRA